MSLAHLVEKDSVPAPLVYKEREPYVLSPAEQFLADRYARLVKDLSFAGIAAVALDRKLPRTIDDYRIVPVTPLHDFVKPTIREMGFWARLPEHVRPEYPGNTRHMPYFDSSLGLGFVYRDRLVAISSAGIDAEESPDTLMITQLQAVHRKTRTNSERYKTGLHAGILWRDTLVSVWEHVAAQSPIGRVGIQGAANNPWRTVDNGEIFVAGYDKVAERRDFTLGPDQNWYKEVPTDEPQPEASADH